MTYSFSTVSATFELEAQLGYHRVAGVDEAGYGAWSGPVAVCAVMLNADVFPQELASIVYDSKKIKPALRTYIHDCFVNNPEYGAFSVEMVWPEEIQKTNVLHATLQGMHRALLGLTPEPCHVLVDGPRRITSLPHKIVQYPIVKGDEKSYSIAMASIIAKVQRDALMHILHQEYPNYGWNTNKGYGTKAHTEALRIYGWSPYHRTGYHIKSLQFNSNTLTSK